MSIVQQGDEGWGGAEWIDFKPHTGALVAYLNFRIYCRTILTAVNVTYKRAARYTYRF